jgi:predicted nucleic acid-binding protein
VGSQSPAAATSSGKRVSTGEHGPGRWVSVFVDTNVLLRSIEVSDPSHDAAVRAIAALIRAGESLIVTPQIMAEFWNVATRPRDRNGIGLTPDMAKAELSQIEGYFTVVAESIEVYNTWKHLVAERGVNGVEAHDARLAAAMKVSGITKILTLNGKISSVIPSSKS